jgi:hypothetical protein
MVLFRKTCEELDRRRAPRFAPDPEVSCLVLDPDVGCWRPATVRDISLTGIALLATEPLNTRRVLTIELRLDKRGFVRKFLIEVRHADICYPNDAWLHGCQFTHPLSEYELQLLM